MSLFIHSTELATMSSIAILVYLSSLAIVTLGQCPQGWTQSTLGNGKCYLVVKDVNMFDQSNMYCSRAVQNGFLTSISSKFENDFVNSLVQTAMGSSATWYWIGANSYGQPMGSTIFNWIDRTPWVFNNWAPGQPDGSPLNCAASNAAAAGQWSVQDCEATYISVCEMLPTKSFVQRNRGMRKQR